MIREGTEEFLKTVNEIYEVYIYSHGTLDYVKKVIELLDP